MTEAELEQSREVEARGPLHASEHQLSYSGRRFTRPQAPVIARTRVVLVPPASAQAAVS